MTETKLKITDHRLPEVVPETAVQISDNSPAGMMMAALSKGMDIEKLEKMLELQERWEANEAKKAYTEAMSLFKANPPRIEKDRKVSYKAGAGTTAYSHASLANVTEKINSGLGEHGLSASWETLQADKEIKVTCTITHKQGHSEKTSLTAAPDISGSKNAIQAIGSTISYLERYTILALTGLATADMDDDGKGADIKYITEAQAKTMTDIITKKNIDNKKFLEYMKVEKIEEIIAKDFQKAMQALKIAKGEKKEDPKERTPGDDDDKS